MKYQAEAGWTAPLVITATAHWAKFGRDVYRALKGIPENASDLQSWSDEEILRQVLGLAFGEKVPASIFSIFKKPIRHDSLSAVGRNTIEQNIITFIERE